MVTHTRTCITIILGLNAVGVQCSHLFLTRCVSQLLGLALVSLAFARIGIHRPSLCLPELLFSISSFCHWISIVFLLYGQRIATHSVNPALTHFLGEFPGLGLDLIPDVVVPEADQRYLEPTRGI